ncbi:MAG: PAS domain S-box protein [Thermodesulfobacteriota bacterium]
MMPQPLSPEKLLAELTEVRRRLAEANELIRAICQVKEDSPVISGPPGDEVHPLIYTLRQQLGVQEALMDTIPNPIFYKSLEEEVLGCNQAFADMVGKPKAEIINQSIQDLFPADLAAVYRQKDAELIDQGGIQEYETEVGVGDGERHPVIARKTLFFQPNGSIGGIIGLLTDITAGKQAEAEHERLSAIITGSNDAIIGKTLEGIITDWNPAAERLYGYTKAEIKGKSVWELVPPEREAELANILAEVRQGKGVDHLPTVRRRRDGTLVEISLTVSPIKDQGGRVVGVSSIARDITEILRQERKLKASQERYRLLVEQIPAVVYKGYADGSVDFFDDKIEVFTGYPKADFDSRRLRWNDLIVPEDLPGYKQKFVEALHGNKSFVREYRIRRCDGEIIWVQGRGRIFLGPDDRVTHISGVLFDITDRKRWEKEIADRQQEMQLILDNSPAYMWAKDRSGRYLYVSKSLLEASGSAAENWIGKTDVEVFSNQELAARYREDDLTVLNTGVPKRQIIDPLETKSGSRWVQTDKVPLLSGEGQPIGVLSMATDITDLRKAAEELEAAAEKWRVTFDAISDGISLLDRDHKIRQCNRAMSELTGRSFADLLGRSCQEALFGPGASPETCPVSAMLQSRQRESLIVPRNGRWLQVSADPIFDKDGEISGVVHIFTDITERQQAQIKIKDLNILLKAIAEINESLLRVKTEPDLFKNTCNSLIVVPKIKFAWIGLLQPGTLEIKVVAHAGYEGGYLATMKVTWDESEWGQGPSGEAIRSRKPVVIEDMETDPRMAPWREEALKRGYRSNIALPLVHQEEIIGVLTVYSGEARAFGSEEFEFLLQVAGDIVVGVKSLRLEQELVASFIQLQLVLSQTVEAIATIAELRDPYTAGHQRRVTKLACALAEEMGLESNRIEGLRFAGFLHDLGKITIPAEILSRPGKLSPYEMSIIRSHAEAGYEILKKISFPWPVAEIVRQHHERLDGSGYPRGLAGEDILMESRILAVADVVEAMASHRPYRASLGIEKALEEITRNKGILYDPQVSEACVRLFTEKGFKLDTE